MVQVSDHFQYNFLLGQQALAGGNAAAAYHHWQICLQQLPNRLDAIRLLANAFRSIGHLSEATLLLNKALQQHPEHPWLMADQANLLLDQGKADLAVGRFIRLAEEARHSGDNAQTLAHLSNALMGLEYSASATPAYKKAIAQQWGAHATEWLAQLKETADIPNWVPKLDPMAPLRVGFMSGDLCDHPVGFLLLPLLQNRSPEKWVPYIYDQSSRVDQTHQQLKSTVPANQWHTITQLNDAAAIALILSDQLDILIDLSGHTGRSRLRLMAHRLAGRQLSWLGFSGSTGLATMDGIILDTISSNSCADQFVETILPLEPSRFCFRPPFAPPLKPPPCTQNGFISFGSFNNTAKYNPELLATWATILQQVPNSKFILKWRTFADAAFKNETLATFTDFGIEPERIDLRGFSTHRQMLDEYNEVDIALDPFPFNGGYTSLEALWMGLPLVTLAGTTPISRQSTSFLHCLDKTNWVAQTAEDYIRIAQELAANQSALAQIRTEQRYQIMDSALYDATNLSRNFEFVLEITKLPPR